MTTNIEQFNRLEAESLSILGDFSDAVRVVHDEYKPRISDLCDRIRDADMTETAKTLLLMNIMERLTNIPKDITRWPAT